MKMTNFKFALTFVLYFTCLIKPSAQANTTIHYPEIGQPFPDVNIKSISNYPVQQTTIKHLSGKWIILDFWNVYCTSCIESFPREDSLQKLFGSELQFFLVGYDGGSSRTYVRKVYEKYSKKYKLNLASAFDSAMFKQLGVTSVPHLLWIDNNGILRAITTTTDLSADNIKTFLTGGKLNVPEAASAKWNEKGEGYFDLDKPILIDGNGASDSSFIFRSILTNKIGRIIPAIPFRISEVIHWGDRDVFQATGVNLLDLYKLAYSGSSYYWPRDSDYLDYYTNPVVEVGNLKPFDIHANADFNLFCYSFCFPAAKYSPDFIQETLQRDLKSYFGYEVNVESRLMPCWKLICTTEEAKKKLRTKGIAGSPDDDNEALINLKMNDISMSILVYTIWGFMQKEPPIVDETGIDFKIDIYMDGDLTNFKDLQENLERNGLRLVKGQRYTRVIIIRDPTKNLAGK